MTATAIPLKVLIVEDSEDDTRLLLRELRRAGYAPEWARVDTVAAMQAALADRAWDIIVSDYMIPGFGGLQALAIAKESGLDLPFVLVSNKVSEETLVEAMRAGATDFLMKDRLDRLGPVVKRELVDAAARRDLKQAQFEWRAAFDAVQDAIFIHDDEFRIVRANVAYAKLGGLPVAQVAGKHYWEVFPKREGPLPGCRNLAETGGMVEERIDGADGITYASRAFAVKGVPGKIPFSVHVIQDITERNRVQEALAQRERHFRTLLEHASDLVIVADLNGMITYISPSIGRVGGYAADEVLGKPYAAFAHPDDAAAAAASYGEIIRNPGVLNRTEFRFRRKDGSWTVLESVARNALADPLLRGIVINARDVTERKLAEQRLQDSEARYRDIFERAKDVIYMIDSDGIFVSLSPSFQRLTGWSCDEWLGKPFMSIVHPDDAGRAVDLLKRTVTDWSSNEFEMRIGRKDGGHWTGEFTVGPIEIGGSTLLFGIGRDVTERKRAEQNLKRLNWALRALGQSNAALVHARTEEELFQSCCDAIAGHEGYPLAWIGFAQQDAARSVKVVAAAGATLAYMQGLEVSWGDTPLGRGPTGMAIRSGVPQVVNDLTEKATFLPWLERARANELASSISLPIRTDGRVSGALVVYSREPQAFDKDEVDLFEELAADIGYGIAARRTHAAYEAGLVEREQATRRLRAAFESLIGVLAATVERRDPYTAGHQRRVAELAAAIARTLGLSREQIEGLHFASTIHDIGKIYVPAEILARPGKLSSTELELVKTHAQVGFEIVKDVEFPWQVADMIRQHHERLDGSGYPQALKGDQILHEARILAVADVVEAMSSHRPYRPGLGIEAALRQIRLEAGARLDEQAVAACERVFREQGFAFSPA